MGLTVTMIAAHLKRFCVLNAVMFYVVWAYYWFILCLRDVEDWTAERGVMISYATKSELISEGWNRITI